MKLNCARSIIIATCVAMGITSVAIAQVDGMAEISVTLTPPPGEGGKYMPGQAITAAIDATLTDEPSNGQLIALRGIQMDYSLSVDVVLPGAMSFSNLSALYAPFPNLPVPAAVYIGTQYIPGMMLELHADEPVELGTIAFNAIEPDVNTVGILDYVNFNAGDPNFGFALSFGFGVDPDDPIRGWTFENGHLYGDQFAEVPTAPDPATLVLLGLGAVAVVRRRRA